MRLQPYQKEELKKRRLIRAFNGYRARLKEDGYAPEDALNAAIKEYLGPKWICTDESVVPEWVKRNREKKKAEHLAKEASSKETPPVEIENPDFDVSLLADKSKPVDMIQWVASNLYGKINFETCPGRDAYGMLMDCKQSPALKYDFWKTIYPKLIPSRSTFIDDDGATDDDGSAAIENLAKIAEISKRAELSPDAV